MAIENEVAKTPREHFTRDADDELPKFKERTLQRSSFGREVSGRSCQATNATSHAG